MVEKVEAALSMAHATAAAHAITIATLEEILRELLMIALLAVSTSLRAASIEGTGKVDSYSLAVRTADAKVETICRNVFADATDLSVYCGMIQTQRRATLHGEGVLAGWVVMAGERELCHDPVVEGYAIVCDLTGRQQH